MLFIIELGNLISPLYQQLVLIPPTWLLRLNTELGAKFMILSDISKEIMCVANYKLLHSLLIYKLLTNYTANTFTVPKML